MLVLRLLLLALAAWLVLRLVRGAVGRPRSRFPCADCRNCRGLFEDGVICAFGDKETFKNETHIANCHDWTPRRAS